MSKIPFAGLWARLTSRNVLDTEIGEKVVGTYGFALWYSACTRFDRFRYKQRHTMIGAENNSHAVIAMPICFELVY